MFFLALQGDDDNDAIHSDYDMDEAQDDEDKNPLVVPLDEEKLSQEEITNKWFSQAIFAKAVEEGDLEEDVSEDEIQVGGAAKKLEIPEEKAKSPANNGNAKPQAPKPEDDFEIVPAPATDSSSDSSSDESDDDDVDRKAEILACAKKMLSKKQREQILDDAYNKYMFHDEGLPGWFVEEERRHRQPIKPITKEEVAAMRAQFKEINARPAKKVAEAKARKKRAAMKKLEKVRKKANTISDQADISDRSKRKMIEQLYKKATPKRPQKEYVVAKKGVKVKVGKGKVLVDRRMKKDTRALQKQEKGGKKGKGKVKNPKRQRSKGPVKGSAMKAKKGSRA